MDPFAMKAQLTHASRETLRIILNVIPQIIWIMTPEGRISFINEKWFDYTGLSVKETISQGALLVLHPDDVAYYQASAEQALKEKREYEMEYRLRRATDGTYRWFLRRAKPVIDESGQVTHWFGTCIDIDDIKRTESKLKAKTVQLDFALNSARAGAWSWDVRRDILVWDQHVIALFGETLDCVKPNNFNFYISRVHPEDRERSDARVKRALAGEDHGEYMDEYRVIWPDGSVHNLCTRGKAYHDQSGEPIYLVGVCWDVTQEREEERKLRELQMQFAQAINHSVIGETASALAHELNQPLTVISTYSQLASSLLEKDNYSHSELREALQQIVKQSERVGAIIHRTKDLARQKTLYLEAVDLKKIVLEAIDFIHYEKFNSTPKIAFDFNPNISPVLIDKVQIQQVIINLVKNSIEAMRNANTKNARIIITTLMETNNFATVTIADNGPGIPQEIRDKLFDHTFTTKPYGMGIGLIICRSIIEAHGGQLTFCPAEGEIGASFKFTLPLSN